MSAETATPGGQEVSPAVTWRRWGPTIAGLMVYAAIAAVYVFGAPGLYHELLRWWGLEPFAYPFVDTEAVLRAFDCLRQGVDVWKHSVCMNGSYMYSPFLLHLAVFPIGMSDRVAVAIPLTLTFLMVLAALPPAGGLAELAIRVLAILSPACAFAVERANIDLAILVLTVIGVLLALRPDGWRHFGYAVFVVAGLIKFYPFVLLLLAARERPRVVMIIGSATAATIALLLIPSLNAARVTPVGSPFGDMFGALNLPFAMFVVPGLPPGDSWDGLRAPLSLSAWGLLAALGVTVLLIALRNLRRDMAALGILDPVRTAFLIAGAVVICGCFFAAQNIAYRAIFLLLVLPGLFALTRATGGRYTALIAAILFLMWEELLRRLIAGVLPTTAEVTFWWIREAIWWWTIARLLGVLGSFTLTSEMVSGLRRLKIRTA